MKKIYSPMFSTFENDIELKISVISQNMIIKKSHQAAVV
jgi:hypothetical protein